MGVCLCVCWVDTCCKALPLFSLTDMTSEIIPEEEDYDDIEENDAPPTQTITDPIDDSIYELLPGMFEMFHCWDTVCKSDGMGKSWQSGYQD